jgi:hypothetical protein
MENKGERNSPQSGPFAANKKNADMLEYSK